MSREVDLINVWKNNTNGQGLAEYSYDKALDDFANELLKMQTEDEYPVIILDDYEITNILKKLKGENDGK